MFAVNVTRLLRNTHTQTDYEFRCAAASFAQRISLSAAGQALSSSVKLLSRSEESARSRIPCQRERNELARDGRAKLERSTARLGARCGHRPKSGLAGEQIRAAACKPLSFVPQASLLAGRTGEPASEWLTERRFQPRNAARGHTKERHR